MDKKRGRQGLNGKYLVNTCIAPAKPGRKQQIMTPQGHVRSLAPSRIPASRDKFRQKPRFPTDYSGLVKNLPSTIPASLVKGLTNGDENVSKRKENVGPGKVKIILRLATDPTLRQPNNQEFLRVEGNRKHVSVFAPEHQSTGNNSLAPKVYAFDSVFTEDSTQNEICSSSLPDVIQAVLQGADGTVFCYGQANLGKTFVLLGRDGQRNTDVGLLPCAICWLYRCINELKEQQGIRFSVGVSAIEVYGRSEKLRDLLSGYCDDNPPSPLCITEDPLMGTQLQNRCEVKAESAEKAAYFLDAALASRSCSGSKNTSESRRHSHMFFTLHVHKIAKTNDVNGSAMKSRLHFIDLGSCDRTLIKTPNSLALSLSSLGHVIMAIANNSKHVPFRESKLTRVLRETLGNVNCRAVMLAHVSRHFSNYSDTLSTIQMASRIHRVIKKKNKPSSLYHNSRLLPGGDCSFPLSKHLRHRTKDDDSLGSSSGMECTSGSELSCDTVIYVNKNGIPMSDRELTDNEGPPNSTPIRKTPYIPPIISEASPPEEGEMVYNIAQAKIHKLGARNQSLVEDSKPADCYNNFHTCQLPHSDKFKNHSNLSKSHVYQNGLVTKCHSAPNTTNGTLTCSTSRPRHSSLPQPAGYKLNPTGSSRSTFSSANFQATATNRMNSVTKLHTSSGESSQESVKKSPVKPPRLSRNTVQTISQTDKKKVSEKITRKSSLPKPKKSVKQDSASDKEISLTKSCQVSTDDKNNDDNSNRRSRNELHNQLDNSFFTNSKINESLYVNVALRKGKTKSCNDQVPITERLQSPSIGFTNVDSNTEFLSISNAQGMNDKEKQHSAKSYSCSTKSINICDSPEYPTEHDERPEPVGCSFDANMCAYSQINNSIPFKSLNNTHHLKLRPDSLFVNLDEDDWIFNDEDDNDAVDINFYCLTFTTRNPLIPMSKSKFTQQIKNNIKRKSLSESLDADFQRVISHKRNPITTDQKQSQDSSDADAKSQQVSVSSLTRSDTFIVEHQDNTSQESEKWAWSVENGNPSTNSDPDPTELSEDDADPPKIAKMPMLECAYVNDTDGVDKRQESLTRNIISRSYGTFCDSPHQQVCLYDSNSLEMSYVNTRQTLSSNSLSPTMSNVSSNSPSKRETNKSTQLRMKNSRPVVMTKSTSKEGARLTLVKKHRSQGPTLELLITNENDNNNNELDLPKKIKSSQNKKNRVSETLPKTSNQKMLRTISKQSFSSNQEQNSRKMKWPGLRRFNSKKVNSKATKTKPGVNETKNSSLANAQCCSENSRLKENCSSSNDNQGVSHVTTLITCKGEESNINSKKSTNEGTSKSFSHLPSSGRIKQTDESDTLLKSSAKRKHSTKIAKGSSVSRFGFPRKSKIK